MSGGDGTTFEPETKSERIPGAGILDRAKSEAQIDDLTTLYCEGQSLRRVASHLQITPSTVAYWLHKRGISLRRRNGWTYQ